MNEQVNEKLRTLARSAGLCDQWFNEWDMNSTNDELIKKYVKGIDFSIEHNWLSNREIKSMFSGDVRVRNGLYLDGSYDVKPGSGTYVIQGASEGDFEFDGFDAATLHVRQVSCVNITCKGSSNVFVHVYEDADVVVSQSGNARVYLYRHGDGCKCTTFGNVLVRYSSTLLK